jgi:D-glycero-alpha-D-manno-heptose 1-phosphate guanylyltransferase
MIDAMILAGGLGTRLREAVPHVPKPLAPINGVAFLDLLLDQIERSGVVKKVVLAVGYKAEMIVDHIKASHRRIPIVFSREDQPLGTGGAVRQAIEMTDSDPVFVFNGDSYLECPLMEMARNFHEPMTLAYTYVEDASRFGQIIIDAQGRIQSFQEKQINRSPGWINGGIYLFDKKVFERKWPEAFSLEKEMFPALLKDGIFGFHTEGLFIDIGTPESFASAQLILKTAAQRTNPC